MTKINDLYTDPAKPGAFSGISGFLRANKNIKKKELLEYFKSSEAYSLHKPKRKNFVRRQVIVSSIDDTWQIDLVDVSKIKDENDGNTFLFTCIDVFSKSAWVEIMESKSGKDSVKAFENILNKSKRVPKKIQCDKGSEFFNSLFKKLCKDRNIHLYSTYSELKACVVERFNRTLREKMQRYFTFVDNNRYVEVLNDLVSSYNNSYHRSIKRTPNSVKKEDQAEIFLILYGLKNNKNLELKLEFKIGDKVRISKTKTIFEKGYLPNWTLEYFFIKTIIPSNPPTYILKDLLDEDLAGSFYEKELQKVEQTEETFRIEKIIKTKTVNKKKFFLIKWLGWPDKFNSWEPEINLKK